MILRPRILSDRAEMEAIINQSVVCYAGMVDGAQPYILPMNFAYEEMKVYLHADPHGYKMDVLRKNPRVCVNFNVANEMFYRHKEVGCSWGMKYKSVNAFGSVRFIEDYQEKYRIMQLVMLKYSGEQYEFNEPAIRNVAVMQVDIEKLTGKTYGY